MLSADATKSIRQGEGVRLQMPGVSLGELYRRSKKKAVLAMRTKLLPYICSYFIRQGSWEWKFVQGARVSDEIRQVFTSI